MASYFCPTHVDRNNWLTVGEDHNHHNTFGITQNGVSITVTRTDGGGDLWCIGLSFECCQGEIYMLNDKS